MKVGLRQVVAFWFSTLAGIAFTIRIAEAPFEIALGKSCAGPFIVGFLNDLYAVRFGNEAIRYSLLTVASTGVLGVMFLLLSSRHVAEDLARRDD